MSLITEIKDDLLEHRKNGTDKLAISELTTLYSESNRIGFDDGKRDPTDAEVMAVIKKFIKGIDECLSYSPTDENYLNRKKLLEHYLPSQLSESELRNVIEVFTSSVGVSGKAEIMKYLKSAYSGKYDGRMAATLADEVMRG
jgi:uncharacterized protein YqeY